MKKKKKDGNKYRILVIYHLLACSNILQALNMINAHMTV